MNTAQAAALLALAAIYDNRSVAEQTAQAWQAALHDLDFEYAKDAVVEHYATSTAYLMPAHIRSLVSARRDREDAEERRREQFASRRLELVAGASVAPGKYGQRQIGQPSPWYVAAKEVLANLQAARSAPAETEQDAS